MLSAVVIAALCLMALHTWWQLLLRDSRDKYQYNFLGAAVLFTTLSVNMEMDEMFRAFFINDNPDKTPEEQILNRYRQWIKPRKENRLIHSVYLVLKDAWGEESVRRLQLTTGQWQDASLPEEIPAAADPGHHLVSSTPVYHSNRTLRIDSGTFTIHIPFDLESASAASGWIVIRLDTSFLIEELYVKNLQGQLQQWGFEKGSIDVIVVNNLQKDTVLYRSRPHLEMEDFDGVIMSLLLSAPRTGTMSADNTVGNPIYNNNGVHHIKVLASKTDGFISAEIWADTYRNLIIGYFVITALGTSVFYFIIVARRRRELAEKQINYVATVSHELLTPLSIIRSAGSNMSCNLIREQEHIQRYGEMITRESKRLSALLTNSLMYARLTNSNRNKDFEPLDIEELVESAIAESSLAFSINAERVHLICPPEHFSVDGNREALQAALLNLLQNAGKYSGPDTDITIRIQAVEPGRVRIAVIDEGIGLKGEDINRLFEPFYRGKNAAGTSAKGTGIGLSLVRQIMQSHGGNVSARSRKHRGAVFTLELPLQERTEKHERHPQDLVG